MKTELQETCTICYEILISPEYITITKEILKNLRFLVQTIDFTLVQHKPICEACVAKIKSACKFKTTYLDLHENFIKVKNEEDVCSVFCEICKDIVNSSDTIPLFDPLSKVNKYIVINHFYPELESRINEDPQTCESCHKSMLNFCNFTNLLCSFNQNLICDENESESVTVKKELQQIDIASTSVNCSEYCSVKIKDEVVQDMKVEKNSIEYNEFIAKNEELDLKMDCEEESGEEGSWTETEIETEKNFLNLSSVSDDIHMVEFKTKDKYIPKSKEPGEIKKFPCELCEYRTIRKYRLKRHMLQHKEPDDTEMFVCDKCGFNTKYKDSLKEHVLTHMKPDQLEKFQCATCEYKTIRKHNLKVHMLQHEKPDGIAMFYCDMCGHKAKHKSNMKVHMLKHDELRKMETFQCELCEFNTKHKYSLKRHSILHKKI